MPKLDNFKGGDAPAPMLDGEGKPLSDFWVGMNEALIRGLDAKKPAATPQPTPKKPKPKWFMGGSPEHPEKVIMYKETTPAPNTLASTGLETRHETPDGLGEVEKHGDGKAGVAKQYLSKHAHLIEEALAKVLEFSPNPGRGCQPLQRIIDGLREFLELNEISPATGEPLKKLQPSKAAAVAEVLVNVVENPNAKPHGHIYDSRPGHDATRCKICGKERIIEDKYD